MREKRKMINISSTIFINKMLRLSTDQNITRVHKIVMICGIVFISIFLIFPLIGYGSLAIKSESEYLSTKCYYDGYEIVEKDCGLYDRKYSGVLLYLYTNSDNKIIYRSLNLLCSDSKTGITDYFGIHYKPGATWECWYDKENSVNGWVGFHQPYEYIDGKVMITIGVIIIVIFVVLIFIYILIQRRNSPRYVQISLN